MQRVERVEQALVHSGLVRICITLRVPGAELVAFVAPADRSAGELHDHLRTSVPADLLPAVYVGLTQFPEFPGGQKDLAQLLELSVADPHVAWVQSMTVRDARSACMTIGAGAAAVRPAGQRLWSPALRDAVFDAELDPQRVSTGYGWLLGAAIDGVCRALQTTRCVLEDVTFDADLMPDPHQRRTIQVMVSFNGRGEMFKVVSRAADQPAAEPQWTEHVTGGVAGGVAGADLPAAMTAAQRQAWFERSPAFDSSAFDEVHGLSRNGEGADRLIDAAWLGEGEVLVRLQIPARLAGCELPALLDACVQAAQALAATRDGQRVGLQGCERLLVIAAPRPGEHWCRLKLRSLDGTLYGNAEVYDTEGRPLLVGEGLYLGVKPLGIWERSPTVDSAHPDAGSAEPVATSSTFLAQWNRMPATQRRPFVEQLIERLTRELTGLDSATPFDASQGFFDAGVNSLGAVMLCVRLQQELGQPLSETLAFSYSTPQQLAAHLCDNVLGRHDCSIAAVEGGLAPSTPATDLDGLSADQLAARLAEQLEQLRTGARA